MIASRRRVASGLVGSGPRSSTARPTLAWNAAVGRSGGVVTVSTARRAWSTAARGAGEPEDWQQAQKIRDGMLPGLDGHGGVDQSQGLLGEAALHQRHDHDLAAVEEPAADAAVSGQGVGGLGPAAGAGK